MIIDGKMIADQIQKEVKETIDRLGTRRKPCLAVILVGNHIPSRIYVNRKTQACASVGMNFIKKELPISTSEAELLHEIDKLNANPDVDGILLQLPLPPQINPLKITQHINPEKDVDGFHPFNVGKMLIGERDGFLPCTPLGIQRLLERTGIEVAGKHVLMIGRSNIVGKPMAALLMQSTAGGNATVTIANRHTENIKSLCLMADIIIVAIGQPKFITADMVKKGCVIIDVGINKVDSPSHPKGYEIVGDADFENLKDKCSFITPVPGGVGPMTIAMLLSNTLQGYLKTHTPSIE
jgi:methylenetetrahydrofolate dehydrogenase (NADP+)/methenyltetrahydrofolate cyclohydrolase